MSDVDILAMLLIWTIVGSFVMFGAILSGTAKARGFKWWLLCFLCGPIGFLLGLAYACSCVDWSEGDK